MNEKATWRLQSVTPSLMRFAIGRVAEWFKAPVLKTGVPARVPWVRIPPLPPVSIESINANGGIFMTKLCLVVAVAAVAYSEAALAAQPMEISCRVEYFKY